MVLTVIFGITVPSLYLEVLKFSAIQVCVPMVTVLYEFPSISVIEFKDVVKLTSLP
jgi:hypothetical protein